MKKLVSFLIGLFFLLITASSVFAVGYVNPKQTKDGFLNEGNGKVTNNSTSVSLMFEGTIADGRDDKEVVPGYCYILGKAYIGTAEPINDASKTETFYVQEKDVDAYGWSANDFGKQAGGNTCGFINNPIQGSGSDTPADYVRADSEGRIWYYNLCENFEGVRTDCNEKFALGKRFGQSLFRVVCGYYDSSPLSVDTKYREDIDKGLIAENSIPKDRSKYQQNNDPGCDISKANINESGSRELQIYELKDHKKTQGKDVSEKKLWQKAFRYLSSTEAGFTALSDLSATNFNPEFNTVPTEFGDISRDPAELATAVLRIAIGVAGGVAFLLMVFGSFRLIFAGGNPESVQNGREIITAAVIGLLVIVFATFILQLIGISILGLNT